MSSPGPEGELCSAEHEAASAQARADGAHGTEVAAGHEIQVDVSGRHGVWQLTLARPLQANALSATVVRELHAVLDRAERDKARAVVVRGAGRHFCAGFDLSHLDAESDDTLLARFIRIELLLQRFARASFLTVAVAHGRTIGAGADLFAACRVRMAEPGTTFAFPGARGFGLVLGTRRLAALVGSPKALEWIEGAGTIGTAAAQQAGLVGHVVASADEIALVVDRHLEMPPGTAECVRAALTIDSELDFARDLAHLVQSAARPGLRERIAAHQQRVSAARRATSD